MVVLSSSTSIVVIGLLNDVGGSIESLAAILATGGLFVGVTALQLLIASLFLFAGERVVR
jgi:hypothetical protein